MTDEPWNRNAGKFDRPTTSVPTHSITRGTEQTTDEDRGRYRGVASIDEPTGEAPPEPDIQTVEGVEEPAGGGATITAGGRLSPDILRGLVCEAERLVDMRRDIALQLRAVRDAAKDRGVNIKAFNELMKRREMDARVRDDFDHCLSIYETVAGLSRGAIEGGELKQHAALSAPQPRQTAKDREMAEALAWAGVGACEG